MYFSIAKAKRLQDERVFVPNMVYKTNTYKQNEMIKLKGKSSFKKITAGFVKDSFHLFFDVKYFIKSYAIYMTSFLSF
jgi:hypothetical protein